MRSQTHSNLEIAQAAKPSRQFSAVILILSLAILATLPGWLPGRIYLPREIQRLGSAAAADAARTGVAADQIRAGEPPLWDSTRGLGEPLLEKGKIGAMSLSILPQVFLKPTWSWTLRVALQLACGGIGTWLLTKRWDDRYPRIIAAAIYLLGAAVAARGVPSVMNFVLWLPLGIWAVQGIADSPTLARLIVGTLVFAGQFLCGDAAATLCLITSCIAGLFVTILLHTGNRRAAILRNVLSIPTIIFSILLGLGLAGVQWLPLFERARMLGWKSILAIDSLDVLSIFPAILAASLFIGWATGRFQSLSIVRLGPLALIIVLLGLTLFLHRGINSTEFADAKAAWAREPVSPIFASYPELPTVWFAPKSEWFLRRADETSRLSEPSFDPHAVALLDEQIPEDNVHWLATLFPDRNGPRTIKRSKFSAPLPELESVESVGGKTVIRIKTPGVGWLILKAAYSDGWTARSRPTRGFGPWSVSTEEIVLPAFGKLRAVPVSESVPTEVVMKYRPVEFRRGLLISGGAAMIVLLATAMLLSRRRMIESSGNRPEF